MTPAARVIRVALHRSSFESSARRRRSSVAQSTSKLPSARRGSISRVPPPARSTSTNWRACSAFERRERDAAPPAPAAARRGRPSPRLDLLPGLRQTLRSSSTSSPVLPSSRGCAPGVASSRT
jgi:hypothetical protein